MFAVYDCGKPASEVGYPSMEYFGWKKHTFETFEEARSYAWKWLGIYGGSYDGKTGVNLEVNKPHDYSGGGHFIEIRKI
jgi:hypothetical protein